MRERPILPIGVNARFKGFFVLAMTLSAVGLGRAWAGELSTQDREVWIRAIKRVKMKPPCCGACKLMTTEDTRTVWEYLTSQEPEKKSGKYLESWNLHKKKLLEEFKTLSPERFQILYAREGKGGSQ